MSDLNPGRRVDALGVVTDADDGPAYSLLARHTGKAKIDSTKEGDKVLTITLAIVVDPENFASVAADVMSMLGEVSTQTDMAVEIRPLGRQRRML